MLHPLQEKINFPFRVMVRESENNVEQLSSRGAPNGIFIGHHCCFKISRVHSLCGLYQQCGGVEQGEGLLPTGLPSLVLHVTSSNIAHRNFLFF